MQIISRLCEISNQFDAVFCDVWGCIHNGVRCFNDAVNSLHEFRSGGGIVLMLTNAPRPAAAVEKHFESLQVPQQSWDLIVTSGDAAKSAMFEGCVGQRIYHIGPKRDSSFFEPDSVDYKSRIELTTFEDAEGIVCTGLFDDAVETPVDYVELLRRASDAGMPFLCANPDRVVDRGSRRVYCAGALAQLYTRLNGKVLMFGKPRGEIYNLAHRKLKQLKKHEIPNGRILCIGDGILTDQAGAMRQALPFLFVTGGLAATETGTQQHPDQIKLQSFLRQNDISVDYAIGHLR